MNEIKVDQFVGIFPNAISVKTCIELVKWLFSLDNYTSIGVTSFPLPQYSLIVSSA